MDPPRSPLVGFLTRSKVNVESPNGKRSALIGGAADQATFRELWDEFEAVRPALDDAVAEAALGIPVLASVLQAIPEQDAEGNRAASRELQRRALVDGEWDGYLAYLREQGANYAKLGMGFRDWYRLVAVYRTVMHGRLLSTDGPADPRIVDALESFLDTALATIGEVYLETKEQIIRSSETMRRLYHEMFRNGTVGMIVYHWDEPPDLGSFRVLDANPAAGATSPGLLNSIGRTIGESAPHLLETPTFGLLAESLRDRMPRNWTLELNDRIFDTRCFPLHDDYVGLLYEDVTERRQMERQIVLQMEELARSNRELDSFAYIASHDLKAPLRDIDNLALWAEEDAPGGLPPESTHHMQRLRDRVGRMERLLDDLLAYSRAGRGSYRSESLRVGDVVDEVLALVAPPPGIEIELVRGGEVALESPRSQLALVLRNLVTNAVKHHDRDVGRVEIAAEEDGDWIRFSISDDGPGIPPRFHERAFRMFQTLRPRDVVEGSGVGLAIVKKVIEGQGGVVTIDGDEGRGATLRFSWPRKPLDAHGAMQ